MKPTLDDYQTTERRLAIEQARRGLTIHGAFTVIVCIGLVILNITVASEFPWSIFPVIGMAIGVAAHWYFGVRHGDEMLRHHQVDIERQAAA
jgi:hypothetical protein